MAFMKPSHMDSLPNIDEATAPFSSLFSDHLDRAAIEATVPLADKTIFLAKDGQRYMFQRITETSADDVRTDRSVSNSSRRGSTHSSSSAAQYTSTHPLADARRQNGLPLETQPPNRQLDDLGQQVVPAPIPTGLLLGFRMRQLPMQRRHQGLL